MDKLLFLIVAATTSVTVISCCQEYPFGETIRVVHSTTTRRYYFGFHNNEDFEPTSPLPYYPPRTEIRNSTIICSDLTSISQIIFLYTEKPYEQHLKIINSNISILQPSSLLSFSTITKLFLSNIHIRTILPGAFNGLTRLRELYLDHNELTELPKGVYNSLHRLEILNLASNRILHIEKFALTGAGSLLELHLLKNNLSKIEDGVFDAPSHLKVLDLSENPVEVLGLEGLSSLEELNLAGSSLQEFNADFSEVTMKVLNLSSSQLSIVDFALFPKADLVDLSKNKIVSVKNCDYLDAIDVRLDHNQIDFVNGTFNGFSKLNMGHNKLEVLKDLYFQQNQSYIELDFSFNSIYSIEWDVFHGLLSLQRLYLQNNIITQIEPGLFRDLKNLKVLNLSQNGIENFEFGTFDSLRQLEILDISHNHLVTLRLEIFSPLKILSVLYFDHNEISSFGNFSIIHFPNLHYISLDNNPWSCYELFKIHSALKFHLPQITVEEGKYHNGPNVYGVACNNSGLSPTQSFQQIFDGNMKNSTMRRFFNEEFKNSKFYRYFQEDYKQSDFFKYLNSYNNYKFPADQQNLYDSRTEKITSIQVAPNEDSRTILVFIAIVLIIITFLLLCGVSFTFGILLKLKQVYSKQKLYSEIETY